ncbi:MAG: hypothetical protein VST70_01075 [Nitrospirota bacterium]|nr:hypothetical protein [Nitrospirota bacterium]
MLISLKPFKGALFDSVIFPKKDVLHFFHQAGPNIAFFHPNEGLMFFSPALRRIWPEAAFGSSLESFRILTERDVVPAEKIHLADFWKQIETGSPPNLSDRFVIKSGRIRGTHTLGLVVFSFPWGRLLVIVPGEAPKTISKNLEDIVRLNPFDLIRDLENWVQDSETEALVAHFLQIIPGDFINQVSFSRILAAPFPEPQGQICRIVYRYRKGEWQREVSGQSSTDTPDIEETKTRHYGVLTGGEVSVVFTVFVGGILPLGTISLPAKVLESVGPPPLNQFLHEASSSLVFQGLRLVSEQFHYCRYWTGQGFAMEVLEEISRLVSPDHWRNMIVLPFWTRDLVLSDSLALLDSVRYTTDILFVEPEKGLGCILLQNTNKEKATTVVMEKFRQRIRSIMIDDPVTVAKFLENH